MPLYDFLCEHGHPVELQLPIAQRNNPGEGCPECGGKLELQISLVAVGTAVPKGDKRIIKSEKQVESQLGKGWRDKGTTGREGGIGRKKHFT